MSRLVDERVVEMSFDNTKFDSNITKSIQSINDLKNSLNFDGVTSDINKDLQGIDTSILADGIEKVGVKFSTLEIAAITAISNITNRLIDMGVKMVENLSVDNIALGWDKFAEKTKSVGTIIGQGYDLSEVTTQLERLNWYTDQTSYDFTSMVNSIGKFTATGQKLDESVEAMMGIANWAALSGQNAETASRAMYQISQAMGAGAMRLIDYRSIQNANMDTDEFRQKVLDTAVAMGKLNKITSITGEVMYSTLNGKEFTKGQFTTQLSEGWFDKDVMMDTFRTYSKGIDELFQYTKENGGSVETAYDALNDSLDEFGMKAFKAAQESRTLMDSIIATKDAVSSSWMSTFEKIFGKYDQAVEVWSNLSVKLWDIFAAGGEARNRALDVWNELGGRDDLFADTGIKETTGAFWNLIYAIEEVINVVKEAWRAAFPFAKEAKNEFDGMAMRYKSLTEWLQKISVNLRMTEERSKKLKGILQGFFATIKFGLKLIKALWDGTKPLRDFAVKIIGTLAGGVSLLGSSFSDFVNQTTLFEKIAYGLSTVLNFLVTTITKAAIGLNNFVKKLTGYGIVEIFKMVANTIAQAVTTIKTHIESFGKIKTSGIKDVVTDAEKTLTPFGSLVQGIASLLKGLLDVIKTTLPIISDLVTFLGNAFKALGDAISNAVTKEGTNKITEVGKLFLAAFGTAFIGELIYMLDIVRRTMQAFRNVIQGFADVLDSTAAKQYAEAIRTMALSILILVAAIVLLAGVDEKKLVKAMATLIALIGILAVFMKVMASMFKSTSESGIFGIIKNSIKSMVQAKSMEMAIKSMISLALAVLILAGALKILSTIDDDKLVSGLIGIAAICAILVLTVKQLEKTKKSFVLLAPNLLIIATSITMMALVVKMLSKLDGAALARGVIALAAISGILVLVAYMAKYMKTMKLIPFTISLIMMAEAFTIMGLAFKIMSTIKPLDILKGVLALSAFVGLLILVSKVTKNMEAVRLVTFAIGMMYMSNAFMLLAGCIAILGTLSIKSLITGFAAMTVFSALFVLLAKVTEAVGSLKLVVFSVAITSMAIAFTLLAGCVAILGTLSIKSLLQGLIAMAAFSALFILLGKNIKILGSLKLMVFSAALSAMAVAFYLLAGAIAILGSLDVAALIKGSAVITAISALMAVMTKTIGLKGAVSLLIYGSALVAVGYGMILFAGAIALMGNLQWKQLAIGMIAVVAVMAALVVVGKLLKEVSPAILIVASALAIFALAVSAIIVACTMFLQTLGIFGETIPNTLRALWKAILSIIPDFIRSIGDFFAAIFDAFGTGFSAFIKMWPKILEGIIMMVKTIIDGIATLLPSVINILHILIEDVIFTIIEYGPKINEAIVKLVATLIAELAKAFPGIAKDIFSMLVTLLKTLGDNFVDILDTLFTMINNFLDKFFERLPELANKVFSMLLTYVKILLEKVTEYLPTLIKDLGVLVGVLTEKLTIAIIDILPTLLESLTNILVNFLKFAVPKLVEITDKLILAIGELIVQLVNSINNMLAKVIPQLITSLVDFVIKLIDGLGQAIEDNAEKIRDVMIRFGQHLINAFKNLFGINSPSKVFAEFGKNIAQGLINGIKGFFTKVVNVTKDLFNKIFSSIASFFTKAFNEGKKFITNLANGMKQAWSSLKSNVTSWVKNIINMFNNMIGTVKTIGSNIIKGLKTGIENSWNTVKNTVTNIANGIKDTFCNIFGIHSPSKVFAEYGMFMDEGLAQGLVNNANLITKSLDTVGTNIENGIDKSGIQEAIQSLTDNIGSDIDNTITITPVLDLSEIQNGANKMNGILNSNNYDIKASSDFARRTADEVTSRRYNSFDNIRDNVNKQSAPINNQSTNITFNITGTNAKDIADEVSKVIQEQVTRRKLNWA